MIQVPTDPRLAELDVLDRTNRLIRLDYSYNTRRRPLDERSPVLALMMADIDHFRGLLTSFASFASYFERIPLRPKAPGERGPTWVNGWFPGLDSITLYGLLASRNPRRYVEVGSGNSTLFARRAIEDHGLRTRIYSIDPVPRADIDLVCDVSMRQRCEDVDRSFFEELTADDILFVDNSHRAFQNSDVTVFFMEILPNLPKGLVYGLHDIFLPWDYPDEWRHRYYNEQYLLASYLIGGAGGDRVLCPNALLSFWAPEFLNPLAPVFENPRLAGIEKVGGAFWVERGGAL